MINRIYEHIRISIPIRTPNPHRNPIVTPTVTLS